MRPSPTYLSNLLAISLLIAASASAGCSKTPKPIMRGEGVVVWKIGTPGAPSTPAIETDRADWALSSSKLSLVVAAEEPDRGRYRARGSVVSAVVTSASENELQELTNVLVVGKRETPVTVKEIRPTAINQRPALTIKATAMQDSLEIFTNIEMAPDQPYATLSTRIINKGKKELFGLRAGDRIYWPDGLTFAPGLGYLDTPRRARVDWIGRDGRQLSYSLVFSEGPMEVDFNFSPQGVTDQVALGSPFSLKPGQAQTYRRILIVAVGGLEKAGEVAWRAMKKTLGKVIGHIDPTPGWALVEASKPGEGPTLVVSAAPDGTFDLSLPAGNYQVTVHTPGGSDVMSVHVAGEGPAAIVTLLAPEPKRLRYRITDKSGQLIPARLIINGIPPTPDPYFGPWYLAKGSRNVLYTLSGEGEVEISRGRYRLTVTRGIEYSISEQEVVIEAAKGVTVRASLKHEVNTDAWIATDLHLHAAPSPDSEVSLEDRVVSLLAENIEFAVATDHNTVTDYTQTIAKLGVSAMLSAAAGIEVTTSNPTWGHFNVWPYPAEVNPPPFDKITPISLFETVRKQAPEAIIAVNHPRMTQYGIGYFSIAELDPSTNSSKKKGYSPDFDAIEVVNGHELKDQKKIDADLFDWFNLLNTGKRYTAIGGSDSHHLFRQWVGYPRTYVQVDDDRPSSVTPDQIAQAIRKGKALVTTGPFIEMRVEGFGPGELVTAKKGQVKVEIKVQAASWIDVRHLEVYANGEQKAQIDFRSPPGAVERSTFTLKLGFSGDAWIVAVVRGEKPMDKVLPLSPIVPFAFTNPVFIDVDGDGIFGGLGAGL